jgi:hypothetical protein
LGGLILYDYYPLKTMMLKKIIIIVCLLGTIGSGVASLIIFSPSDFQQRFVNAHDTVENAVFPEVKIEELKIAVIDERAAAKDLLVNHGINQMFNQMFTWTSMGLSSVALITTAFARCKKA